MSDQPKSNEDEAGDAAAKEGEEEEKKENDDSADWWGWGSSVMGKAVSQVSNVTNTAVSAATHASTTAVSAATNASNVAVNVAKNKVRRENTGKFQGIIVSHLLQSGEVYGFVSKDLGEVSSQAVTTIGTAASTVKKTLEVGREL